MTSLLDPSPLGADLRATAAEFTRREVVPHLDDWEAAGLVPRGLHVAAARQGLLGISFPEAVGGQGGDLADVVAVTEGMLAEGASSGLLAALFTGGIALPHLAAHGSADLVDRFVRPTLAGEAIGSLAITEPDGGSDVAHLRTRARRVPGPGGDEYVVDGAKTYITSAVRADFLTVAVRTGGPGAGGVSLLVVETDRPGVTVTGPLPKMGWHCSDTGEVALDGVRVPVGHLIGEEGGGFAQIGEQFVTERIVLAVHGYGIAARALALTAAWCRDRETFGRPLTGRQVVRHRLVEMHRRVEVARTYVHHVVAEHLAAGPADQPRVVADACLAKQTAVECAAYVTDAAVQLHGGAGYVRGEVERHYRDARLLGIGGGSTEVLADLAAGLLGYGGAR